VRIEPYVATKKENCMLRRGGGFQRRYILCGEDSNAAMHLMTAASTASSSTHGPSSAQNPPYTERTPSLSFFLACREFKDLQLLEDASRKTDVKRMMHSPLLREE
jgi:hypothetical protein